MKFCKDCAHYRHAGNRLAPQLTRCASPKNGVDMVTGKIKLGFCDVNREFHCGRNADWFEPKPKPVEKKSFWKFW